MNALFNIELADFIKVLIAKGLVQDFSNTIRKEDVLSYYRETKQAFINLGGLLISQTDGRFYIFNHQGELVGIDRIQL